MTIIEEQELSTDVVSDAPVLAPTWQDFSALEQRLDKQSARFNGWTMFIWAFSAVAVIMSLIAIGFGFRAIDEAKRTVRSGPAPAGVVAPGAAALLPTSAIGPVTLTDFTVKTAATTVSAGSVDLQISNGGKVQHELLVFKSDLAPSAYPVKDGNIDEESALITKVSDGENLDPGTSQSRTIDLTKPGTYLFVCNLVGHFKAGMFSVVTVK